MCSSDLGYGLDTTAARALESRIFPEEYFSYQITNLTSFSNLKILSSPLAQSSIFEYSSPANIIKTSTSALTSLRWKPENRFTFPKFKDNAEFGANNGEIVWRLRARSFASNSLGGSRPTSAVTDIRVLVYPVNDKPRILNSETEALATQDQPFSFTIQGSDEEETNSLLFLFATKACDPEAVPPVLPPACNPGDMDLNGGDIRWNPTNVETKESFYDVQLFAKDTGRITDVAGSGLASTAPLTSEIYTLRIFLSDLDDPAIRDGSVNPLLQTSEDQLYTTSLRYEEPDFSDIITFRLIRFPFGMTIEDEDGDGEANISWIPELPGNYPITVEIQSTKKTAVRSFLYYNFSVEVTPVNDPPLFTSIAPTVMKENVQIGRAHV